MRGRKLVKGLLDKGLFVLLLVVISLGFGFEALVRHGSFGFYVLLAICLPPLTLSALIALPVAFTWGRYKRSVETTSYQEVLGPLAGSDEEFCLLLRPFGADGEVVLQHAPFGASTIEQIVARAARKSLGLKTYAMVDQDRRLAPPGPEYMRSPHDEWQTAVRTLLRRAHSIVLVLPPGQSIREALKWEIGQIALHDLRTRLIVVVPPGRLHRDDHARAFRDACLIMVALQECAGSIDAVDSLRIHEKKRTLLQRTHVLKYCRSAPEEIPQLRHWFDRAFLGRSAETRFLQRVFRTAFRTTEQELSGLGFSARYPWPLS